jgi:cell wall assembly regulator SMI1
MRSSSTTALRIPSSAFIPDHRRPASGIQLQELSPNGVQPPPPVVDSWARIDSWAETNYPELYDQLSYPATSQDVDDLEAELDCTLPMDVRQSLYVHDGQDRGGRPTGILFGVTLLDCEEIVEEWQLWKTVAQAYASETLPLPPPPPPQPEETAVSSAPITPVTPATPTSLAVSEPSTSRAEARKQHRQSRLFGSIARFANSRPPDTIQKVYAHPAWIPLAKDFSGNNIAVDLCPGPRGTWGQVILFGRDCETKYVVARSWASFLAAVADDFEGGEARFDGEDATRESYRSTELRIRPCQGARDDTFIEVMKARVRLREKEIRRRKEQQMQKRKTINEKEKSPTVDLMVNSPILNGDGIPSPNLPRSSEGVIGSPVVGTPTVSTPALPQRQDTVTISGPAILAKEKEEIRAKGIKIVSGGVVIDSEDVIPVSTLVKTSTVNGVEDQTKASTALGIEDNKVVNGDVT